MQTKRPIYVLIVLVVAALAAAGYYAYNTYFVASAASGALNASGTVEAAEVLIAPELSGKVTEVLVKEGDQVKAGDVLFRLDDTLLQAQRNVAAAGLETARAAAQTAETASAVAQSQYDLTLTAALAEQKANRSADWTATQPAEFAQPAWYFEQAERLTSAQNEVTAAQSALEAVRNRLTSVEEKATSGDFISAEKRLMDARAAFEVAQNVLTTSANADQNLKDSAQKTYDDTLAELNSAQKEYDEAATTSGASDVLAARANLRVAQERYDTAQDKVRALQTGSLSPKMAAAQKVLDQTLAAVAQAKMAAAQAEASLALIDAQINKLTVTSPIDGTVLTRAIEPGEVVMPGSSLMTLSRLSDLTITVYIPEDRYGELALGQTAQITADSFPGVTFSGTVINISGQAEFTPRNVQTTAGRKTTVFAITLSLTDSDGKLKPGMPADVLFK
jgi:multidrug resistance efflux pump